MTKRNEGGRAFPIEFGQAEHRVHMVALHGYDDSDRGYDHNAGESRNQGHTTRELEPLPLMSEGRSTSPAVSSLNPPPWMTVVDAARYAGFPCVNGRAPNSFYDIAKKIGYRFHGRWLIARDDLDAYIRGERQVDGEP